MLLKPLQLNYLIWCFDQQELNSVAEPGDQSIDFGYK